MNKNSGGTLTVSSIQRQSNYYAEQVIAGQVLYPLQILLLLTEACALIGMTVDLSVLSPQQEHVTAGAFRLFFIDIFNKWLLMFTKSLLIFSCIKSIIIVCITNYNSIICSVK